MVTYIPATRQRLEEMTPNELLEQYHSLRDWVYQNKKLNFERDPKVSKEKLVAIIDGGQNLFSEEVLTNTIANALEEWGKTHPGPILTIN